MQAISVNRRPPRTAADAARIAAHVRRLRRNGSLRAEDQGCGAGGHSMLTSAMRAFEPFELRAVSAADAG